MKKTARLAALLLSLLLIAAVLSLAVVRTKSVPVSEGFVYGPVAAQVSAATEGTFTVKYYGYPSTYKEQHIFKADGDVINNTTYDFQAFDGLYVLSNLLFWLALFIAVLSPVTIFWRPKATVPAAKNEPENLPKQPQSEHIPTKVDDENTGH